MSIRVLIFLHNQGRFYFIHLIKNASDTANIMNFDESIHCASEPLVWRPIIKISCPSNTNFPSSRTHWGSSEDVSRGPAFLHCRPVHFLYIASIMTDTIILLSLKTWQLYAILTLTSTCTVNSLTMWSRNLNKLIES